MTPVPVQLGIFESRTIGDWDFRVVKSGFGKIILLYKYILRTILNKIYKEPTPNKYLATFTEFLVENRGHYMIENIIEDGLNDFFYAHIIKMNEAWLYPIHFVGSVAFGFKDILRQLALSYEIELGTIVKSPMQGLITYHQKNK